MQGRKGEPGLGTWNLQYSSVTCDATSESATLHSYLLYRSSSSSSHAVSYALSQLGISHLSLKDEQKQSNSCCLREKGCLCFRAGSGKSICFHAFPFMRSLSSSTTS